MPFRTGITWSLSPDPQLSELLDHSKFVPVMLKLHGVFSHNSRKEKGVMMAVFVYVDVWSDVGQRMFADGHLLYSEFLRNGVIYSEYCSHGIRKSLVSASEMDQKGFGGPMWNVTSVGVNIKATNCSASEMNGVAVRA